MAKISTRELLAVIHAFPSIIEPDNFLTSMDKWQAAILRISELYPFDAAYSAEAVLDPDSKWQRQVDESLGKESKEMDSRARALEVPSISLALRKILKGAFSDLASEKIPDAAFWHNRGERKIEEVPAKLKKLDEWAKQMEQLYGKELELPEISKDLLLKNLIEARKGGQQR